MGEDAFPEKRKKKSASCDFNVVVFRCFFLSTSGAEYKKKSISCTLLTSHTSFVCLSPLVFFFSLFFFLAQRIDCFSMNLFWGDDGGMIEGGAGEVSGGEKCIMGTTACIKEEQCIGPGSGGRRWRRLRSSPVCLNQRFQKPERVGERAAPPCGQIVFDTPTPPPPPHSLFSLLWGIFFFFSGNP